MVLKTIAQNGAFGSGARRTAWLVRGSTPSTSPASAGEGNSFTMRSISGAMPMPRAADAQSTGTAPPLPMARRRAPSISSSLIAPSSRYLASRSSSVSAAASASFSRAALAASISSPGISASRVLPSLVSNARIAMRSTTPVKPPSLPIGRCSGTRRPFSRFCSDSSAREKSARSRSRRLITIARGRLYSLANFHTRSVCTCTPATASTTTTAAPATRSPARASATKSPYPGVSIRLMRWPL